jgi:hypothetical protein
VAAEQPRLLRIKVDNNPDNPDAQKNATWGFLIAALVYAVVAAGSFAMEKKLLDEEANQQQELIAQHSRKRASTFESSSEQRQ